MSLPALFEQRLRLPLVAAPMFLVSGPGLGDARIQISLENELLHAITD